MQELIRFLKEIKEVAGEVLISNVSEINTRRSIGQVVLKAEGELPEGLKGKGIDDTVKEKASGGSHPYVVSSD